MQLMKSVYILYGSPSTYIRMSVCLASAHTCIPSRPQRPLSFFLPFHALDMRHLGPAVERAHVSAAVAGMPFLEFRVAGRTNVSLSGHNSHLVSVGSVEAERRLQETGRHSDGRAASSHFLSESDGETFFLPPFLPFPSSVAQIKL